jgi:F0F1-type ATP synthase assembly protein I
VFDLRSMRDFSGLKLWAVVQAVVVALFLPLVVSFSSRENAAFFLAGFSVNIAGQLIFAIIFFRYAGALFARDVLRSAYIGEILKLVVFAVLFNMIFSRTDAHQAMFVLAGFSIAQLAFVVCLVIPRYFRGRQIKSR